MAFDSEFAEALGEIDLDDDLLPAAFTWNGNDYRCVASGATKGGRLESYGWGIEEDLVIIVRTGLFSDALPARGQTIVFRGATLRIDRVLTGPGSSFLRLACVNASKGA